MSSKRINSLFTSTENLSRKDIELYRETSNEAIKQGIEEKALGSDFDADALEGWSNASTGISAMKQLDKKYKSSSLKWWGISSSIVVVTGLVCFFLFSPVKPTSQHPAHTQFTDKTVVYEKTDLVVPEAIEEMKELPQKKQIQVATLKKDYTIQQQEQNTTTEKGNLPVTELPVKPVETTPKPETDIKRNQTFAKEIYLAGMKLVDYRNYRSKPAIETKQIILNGTPASKENTNSKEEEVPGWETVEIPYIDYIDKSMSVFVKGNNKKSLSRFEIILKTYPDDINANFYGGLCYFNLQEYEKAIAAFEKCLRSEFSNFNEEAEWYLAKSYLANGEKEKSSKLFETIEKNGGYYAKQAAAFGTKSIR